MRAFLLIAGLLTSTAAVAAEYKAEPVPVPEWKAVYGRVEARDTVPARARIGGVVVDLLVTEGDEVTAGQTIATVRDDKLDFQIAAQDARLRALASQLDTAESELKRAQTLVERGVMTRQRLDQLQTAADVARNEIAATPARVDFFLEHTAALLAPRLMHRQPDGGVPGAAALEEVVTFDPLGVIANISAWN